MISTSCDDVLTRHDWKEGSESCGCIEWKENGVCAVDTQAAAASAAVTWR